MGKKVADRTPANGSTQTDKPARAPFYLELERRMSPRHPRWEEFIEFLSGPKGCNFHRDPGDLAKTHWDCDGSHRITVVVLAAIGFTPSAVAASLDYFVEHGGYCDCEVVFNVEASVFPEAVFPPMMSRAQEKRHWKVREKRHC